MVSAIRNSLIPFATRTEIEFYSVRFHRLPEPP